MPFSPTSKPSPYLEENLQLDYNHLESTICFCTGKKDLGAILCRDCMGFLSVEAGRMLLAMKPGEGLCSAAAIAQRESDPRRNARPTRGLRGIFG
jgi:hypothetical protein